MQGLISSLVNFIAPRECLVCSGLINPQHEFGFICPSCIDSIPLAPENNIIKNRFFEKFDKVYLDNASALIDKKEESGYMNLIYHLKYQKLHKIGPELGKLLSRRLAMDGMIEYDYIIPVPIHPARFRERGYNQAMMIAQGIKPAISGEISEKTLAKENYTVSQTKLDAGERRKNIGKSLSASNEITGKTALIVDDVLTTGSTLNKAAAALKEAGATKVDCAAVILA
jgi:ComF family protein